MTKSLTLILIVLASTNVMASEQKRNPACLMAPKYTVLKIPKSGFTAISYFDESDLCDASGWDPLPHPSKRKTIRVGDSGPGGSGHFWNITVGLIPRGAKAATRGFCVTTSTVGWRTIREFSRIPLPWQEDLNKDGKDEFILWDSFPLMKGEPTMVSAGLMVWVYELSPRNIFKINWRLTRKMAAEIAASYKKPHKEYSSNDRQDKAAKALDRFISGRCRIPNKRNY